MNDEKNDSSQQGLESFRIGTEENGVTLWWSSGTVVFCRDVLLLCLSWLMLGCVGVLCYLEPSAGGLVLLVALVIVSVAMAVAVSSEYKRAAQAFSEKEDGPP